MVAHAALKTFTTSDYVLFSLYFALSIAVSVWSAYRAKEPAAKGGKTPKEHGEGEEPSEEEDYFMAGRSANAIVVAVSLLSGLTSGISFIGIPAYTFAHGGHSGFGRSRRRRRTGGSAVAVLGPLPHPFSQLRTMRFNPFSSTVDAMRLLISGRHPDELNCMQASRTEKAFDA